MKYLKKDDLTGRQYVFACFFITAIILIVYGRWINNYFSGDDFFGITSVIKMRMNFLSCVERYSWLMSSLSSYIDMLIFGINPAGYNITNIILHVLYITGKRKRLLFIIFLYFSLYLPILLYLMQL